MASIKSAMDDAFTDKNSIPAFIVLGIPVFFMANSYFIGQMSVFYALLPIVVVVFYGYITRGICNAYNNQVNILTNNVFHLVWSIMKSLVVVIPNLLIFGSIGYFLLLGYSKIISIISLEPDIQANLITVGTYIISLIFGSLVLTSYLLFARHLSIKDGYNYKLMQESAIDILIAVFFMLIGLLIANLFLVGPVAYLFYHFHIPFTHWTFIAYCSYAFVVNIAISSNYLAQVTSETIVDESGFLNTLIDSENVNDKTRNELKKMGSQKQSPSEDQNNTNGNENN